MNCGNQILLDGGRGVHLKKKKRMQNVLGKYIVTLNACEIGNPAIHLATCHRRIGIYNACQYSKKKRKLNQKPQYLNAIFLQYLAGRQDRWYFYGVQIPEHCAGKFWFCRNDLIKFDTHLYRVKYLRS